MIVLDLPPTGFMLTTAMLVLWLTIALVYRQSRKRAPGCLWIAGLLVTIAIMTIEWYRIP